MIYLEVDD